MALIPWRPFFDLDKFFENIESNWFLPVIPRWETIKPPMDVYETDKDVVVDLSIPDFDPEKIEVSVKDGILKISGKIDEEKEEKDKDYWRKEIKKESFERMVKLPTAVKEDSVEATYEKGILHIVMPKVETKPLSKVKIKVKEDKKVKKSK